MRREGSVRKRARSSGYDSPGLPAGLRLTDQQLEAGRQNYAPVAQTWSVPLRCDITLGGVGPAYSAFVRIRVTFGAIWLRFFTTKSGPSACDNLLPIPRLAQRPESSPPRSTSRSTLLNHNRGLFINHLSIQIVPPRPRTDRATATADLRGPRRIRRDVPGPTCTEGGHAASACITPSTQDPRCDTWSRAREILHDAADRTLSFAAVGAVKCMALGYTLAASLSPTRSRVV